MSITVYIPTPYRAFTGDRARLEAGGATVAAVLHELEGRYPALRGRVLDERGAILRHVNVYVNDRLAEELGGPAAPLREGDQVALIPALMGGAGPMTEEQIRRYSRHIILPEVGGRGQKRLLGSRVLIIGAGGLGSPAALYLAAAGVGTLGIVDFDKVDLSNLQRQILHHTHDIGRPKVESAIDTIADVNPDVKVVPYPVQLSSANVKAIFAEYDVIVNGCDNFPTRYLANDAAVLLMKPMVDGSIFKFEGQVNVFKPGLGCYRCLYPAPPPPGLVPSCAEAGVLGVLCGIIASIQGIETIKLLLGLGESLAGRLLFVDALSMEFRQVRLRRDPNCPVCGDRPSITDLIDYNQFCGIPAAAGVPAG